MNADANSSQGAAIGSPQSRKAVACEACRSTKVRCHGGNDQRPCQRCAMLGMSCNYLPSRRGRPKGSKNRKTMESGTPALSRAEHWDRQNSTTMRTSTEPPLLRDIDTRRITLQVIAKFRNQFPVHKNRDTQPANAESPFDRAQNANQAITEVAADGSQEACKLPELVLPPEDSLRLSLWTPSRLSQVVSEQRKFYKHGVFGIKRDASSSLDPIHAGVVSYERVLELFSAYFTLIHPHSSILDPDLHTVSYVKSRSSFLFTAILLIGAMSLSSRSVPPVGFEEVSHLKANLDKIDLIIHATGARSEEIIQATLILADNPLSPSSLFDDDRHVRLAAATRMAAEIGVHLVRNSNGDAPQYLLELNDIRIKVWLLIFDTKYYIFHNGFMADLAHFELSPKEIERLEMFRPGLSGANLCAFYQLFMFQRRMRARLDQAVLGKDADLALDAELSFLDNYLHAWEQRWCIGEDVSNWIFRHESLTARLLFNVRTLGMRSLDPERRSRYHVMILQTSEDIFHEALRHQHIPHLSLKTGIIVFAAGIILRLGGRQDLVLQTALRMAGDPDNPPLNTFTKQNGYQMLAMLATKQPKVTPAADTRDMEWLSSIFDDNAMDPWDFSLLANPSDPLLSPELPQAAPMVSADFTQEIPLGNQISTSPNLVDLQAFAQAIAAHASTNDADRSALDLRILEALTTMMAPPT